MAERIITGFHAIEEKVLKAKEQNSCSGMSIVYGKNFDGRWVQAKKER